jgi:hypothetical protein
VKSTKPKELDEKVQDRLLTRAAQNQFRAFTAIYSRDREEAVSHHVFQQALKSKMVS